ncbi:MAG: endo-1,4-beta-xylanase [Oceanospirillaceae bacterium]|nr:endo-1,4-beta-xylanase [Oceanospirillaceae bacterium]
MALPKFIILAFLFLLSCSKGNVEPCNLSNGKLHQKVNFPVGAAIEPNELYNLAPYATIVESQFNSITAETIMKPAYLHPQEGVYSWGEADSLVRYCEANNVRLHGHTLIWHQQLPQWIVNFEGDRAAWDALLKDHVQSIVSHFRGKVSGWDVVNEAFNEDGTLRSTVWKENLGASYIEKAFRYAREADPNAVLFYNDYSLALNPKKRKAVMTFLKDLRSRGVPVDGIGMQGHIFIGFPEVSEFVETMNECWRSGFEVHVSELDVSMNPFGREMPKATESDLHRQANVILQLFQAYRQIPTQFQYGITFWGVGDGDSWIRSYFNREDYPLMFDDLYRPKPAYCKLMEQL